MLEEGVGGEDRVVRLDDGGGDLGRRVDGEAELGLAAVVDGEALEEERAEAGAGAAADGVEAEEALEAGAVVRELADAVEHEVDDLLADGVVAAGVELSRPLRNGSGVCTARFGDTVADEATFLRGGVESTPDMWTTPRFMTSVTSPCCGRT